MTKPDSAAFLAGVIEGFYGQPWSPSERLELLGWMADWGLNTYFYCPKDDLKHRTVWRELYTTAETQTLGQLIQGCRQRQIHFVYGLGPGLDLRYRSESDLGHLTKRFEQILALGCDHFALLFDDIPDQMDPADIERWGSLAAAQAHVVNTMFRWLRERQPTARLLFCPTPYCGRMAKAKHGGEDYLPTIGRELLAEIDVLWTGPEIISREISVAHAEEMRQILRRKPLIWDNLHANDYDGRRFYCGPYAGRPIELRDAVSGLLSNPNCEFPLNYVPLRTLAGYVHAEGNWDPRAAYLEALGEWSSRFAAGNSSIPVEDLLLLTDSYYLPYEEGPAAEQVHRRVRDLLAQPPATWNEEAEALRQTLARLRDTCARLAELRDRPLFYALSRRIWELREEADLLYRYIGFRRANPDPRVGCGSDFHLPETYRGGMVARLQRLLLQGPDGNFFPAQTARRLDP